jgi:diacylglycerol O-acyltransferase / wax synthase
MEASTIALSPEDRAILDLESPRIAGHTCKVIVLEGRPGIDELREEITMRLDAAPELTRRLDGPADAPVWREDSGLDPTAHVVSADAGGEMDAGGLRGEVGRLFAERLDRSRPLWRIDVVPVARGGSALVWRIHHALADGTTAIRLARAVLFDTGTGAGSAGAPAKAGSTRAAAEDDARRRRHLAGLLRREFARSRTPSPFDDRIGTRREVDFARIPLGPLHDGAKRHAGATINDAVLACVAGGLRQWIEQHHGRLDDLRVKVPVSLHQEGDSVGNRDSYFALCLPISEADSLERLRRIHAESVERKEKHDAAEIDRLARELERAPRMKHLANRLASSPRRFALNVSNVPGPREKMTILNAPVVSVHSLAEIGERHALRIAALSYGGELYLGLCADPDVVHDLGDLARAIEAEAQLLL